MENNLFTHDTKMFPRLNISISNCPYFKLKPTISLALSMFPELFISFHPPPTSPTHMYTAKNIYLERRFSSLEYYTIVQFLAPKLNSS